MAAARPLPDQGSIFLDPRGGGRALRVSWHHESGLVVLSLWRENVCAGSFRLAVEDVPEMIALLASGLDQAYERVIGPRRRFHDPAETA
jgi:hypothetical protein